MSWTIDDFNSCFNHGMVLRVRRIHEDGKASCFRLRRKKWTYYEDGDQLLIKITLCEKDSITELLPGDILFRNAKDMEVSVHRPGLSLPLIEVKEKKLTK